MKRIVAISVICALGLFFNLKYINEFPSYIHAWGQSDRYALALGFVENDLNFFKPQTFVMNHNFPDGTVRATDNSITSVDFPIHDYIPAVFMKISGVKSPWIFRTYILLYSFVGLFFLFRLSYLYTNDTAKSFLVILFTATSPVFVYYQAGFFPTIPSLSNAIIAFFFYLKYLKQQERRDFSLAIVFLTLATLSRTTFAIPLFAVFCFELLKIIKKENKLKNIVVPFGFSFLVIAGYHFYNDYLSGKYGSIFLGRFIPADNWEDAKEIISDAWRNWGTQYFSSIHYFLLLGLLIAALVFIMRKGKAVTFSNNSFGLLIIIMFLGNIVFAILMLRQYRNHDYYFLDTFFLPIILLFIAILSAIPKLKFKYADICGYLFVAIVSVTLIVNAAHSQSNRRATGDWDRTMGTINNFSNSESFLDSLKISPTARILAIDTYTPNIPFILMNRKGYFVITTSKKNIEEALQWKFDYIVIQDEYFVSDTYAGDPEIITRIKKISDNGKISVCVLSNNVKEQTLKEFLESGHH